ncbi:MAG: peptidoglycan recognition protein family protein [Phycisphaerales bacterium]|nr:peptidoglycan recognition protein family protein [Phycisphaerales bacterium]
MQPLSRRQIVISGSVAALGAAILPSCARRTDGAMDMPGPMWPSSTARPMAAIPSAPAGPAIKGTPFPTPSPLPADSVFPNVISRSAWTRAGLSRPRDVFALGRVSRITVHHDGMNPFTSTSQNESARRLELIRQSHVNKRGWADIGYHYILDPAGRVWQGRSVQYQGAHVQDQNENNLGIMCMGNYDRQSPTPAMLTSLMRFVGSQMKLYGVPTNRVYTHQEINPTECPGRSIQAAMRAGRSRNGALALVLTELNATHLA